MSDLKECKIIDTIDATEPSSIIQTPCRKFLIGIECQSIFTYDLETKQKIRIAGSVNEDGYQDGTRNESRFNCPQGLTLSKDLKTLFVADWGNRVIRAICVVTGVTTTFVGQVDIQKCIDGPKEKACFAYPITLKLSPDGNMLLVSDHNKLRTICIETGQVNTIETFEQGIGINDLSFSPDGKHVIICHLKQVLKFNLDTQKSNIILKGKGGYINCDLSNDGQLLFILSFMERDVKVFNLVTNEVIATTITRLCQPFKITIVTNTLCICDFNELIQVLDISNYCSNFKTFAQLQLSKYSFLPRQVIKSFSI